MTPQFILSVAAGGAIGSVARYLVGIWSGKIFGINFPWGTMIINVTGSFLIGLFVGLFATKWDLPQATRIFLIVGICGGYTTFSTFSLDSFYLMERGEAVAAGAYMIGSVVLSLGALIAAMLVVRALPNYATAVFKLGHRGSKEVPASGNPHDMNSVADLVGGAFRRWRAKFCAEQRIAPRHSTFRVTGRSCVTSRRPSDACSSSASGKRWRGR
jgi:fluoride exporter